MWCLFSPCLFSRARTDPCTCTTRPLRRRFSAITKYGGAFHIRNFLPPYAVHAYLLIVLSQCVPAVWAEKILACLCILVTAFGFRTWARSIGPLAEVTAIFAVPFALHRFLLMGFYNYSLAIGLAFYCLACWRHIQYRFSLQRALVFVGLLVLMTLTHPVPLAIVLLLIASHEGARTFVRLWRGLSSRRFAQVASTFKSDLPRWALLSVGAAAAAYVNSFTAAGLTSTLRYMNSQPVTLQDIVRDWRLVLSAEPYSPVVRMHYRHELELLWLVALVIFFPGAIDRVLGAKATFADFLVASGICVGLAYPIVPWEINGSAFFGTRLTLLFPLLLLAGASAALVGKRGRLTLGVFGLVVGMAILYSLAVRIWPIARHLETLQNAELPSGIRNTLVLARAYSPLSQVSFDPCFWAGAALARRSHSVLENGPWLEQSHIMLSPGDHVFSAVADQNPVAMLDFLNQHPEQRSRFLTDGTLLVVSNGEAARSGLGTEWIKANPDIRRLPLDDDWFELYLCRNNASTPVSTVRTSSGKG